MFCFLEFSESNYQTEVENSENQDPNVDSNVDTGNETNMDVGEGKLKGIKPKGSTAAQKVSITYEKYRNIANMIVLFMRQEEDKPITDGECHIAAILYKKKCICMFLLFIVWIKAD